MIRKIVLFSVVTFLTAFSLSATGAAEPKDATAATKAANAQLLEQLPFDNDQDFQNAKRGFIAALPEPVIRRENGDVVYDLEAYGFLKSDEAAPGTVNASLWRQGQLLTIHGLFKIADRIYQVRNYDLANTTLIQGDTGWIVIDTMLSSETMRAALDLANEHLGERAVVAVIYTHSHADHFGGVRGVVDEQDLKAGKVKIVAPEGFMEETVSENIMVGNVMSRRAGYMYGNLLPKGVQGNVGTGLGMTTSSGTITLIPPTDTISETGTRMTIDGIDIVFQNTPGAEAPAEMIMYFPQFKALCLAEDVSGTMHNLYTLRGAKVRDALKWSKYIGEAVELFGDEVEIAFGSHHWPHWGNAEAVDYMKKQRDLYRYIHDQTLRLANHGYTMLEIAEMLTLPDSLGKVFYNRGYYGTLSHNAKAVYQRYLGWYSGNPADLHPLPPSDAGKKYLEFMGGADAVLDKARESYERGEYRWVAQVVNHVVFAEPDNEAARQLQADALEQLGYQAEAGPWRNFYLTGAQELRQGVQPGPIPNTRAPDLIRALSLDNFFDFLALRLNGLKADGKAIALNFRFPDTNQEYVLSLENSVLNHQSGKQAENADAVITLKRATLNEIMLGQTTFQEKIASGDVQIEGRPQAFGELFSLLDKFELWFNIVTP